MERIKEDGESVRERRIAYAELNLAQFASAHLAELETQQQIPLHENGTMTLSVRCVRVAHVDGADAPAADRSTAPSPTLAATDLRREIHSARREFDDCSQLLCASFEELESRQILLEDENRWLRAEADGSACA